MSIISESSSNPLLEIAVPLLDSHLTSLLSFLWRLGQRIFSYKAHGSMYEVLDHEVCLELVDREGKMAIYSKRQQVRFLQDNIIAFQDQAWGTGNIFATYKCSPGVAVDRYREGHLYRILISLRETKNAGDMEEFRIERTITDGFTKLIEHLQTQVDHATRKLSLCVIFPAQRLPKKVTLIEQHSTRMFLLGPESRSKLPDGREQVIWSTDKPRLFESYVIRWEW